MPWLGKVISKFLYIWVITLDELVVQIDIWSFDIL